MQRDAGSAVTRLDEERDGAEEGHEAASCLVDPLDIRPLFDTLYRQRARKLESESSRQLVWSSPVTYRAGGVACLRQALLGMAAAGDGGQASGALEVVDLPSEDDRSIHCFHYCCHCC